MLASVAMVWKRSIMMMKINCEMLAFNGGSAIH
jgi:hypothetical protein